MTPENLQVLFWITHPTIGSWVHYPKETEAQTSYKLEIITILIKL